MTGKVPVRFLPGVFSAEVVPGTTLLDAAREAHAPLEAPCDGAGVCGKCLVHVDARGRDALELDLEVQAGGVERGRWVLACQARVRSGLTASLRGAQEHGLEIVEHGRATTWPLCPHVTVQRRAEGAVVQAAEKLLAVLPNATVAHLGLAVDIGTTTLVVALVDLTTGAELAVASALNPQTEYGHDVLSRIRFASDPGGVTALQSALMRELNLLVEQVCRRVGAERSHIHEAVLAGNTCMLHIAAGIDPAPLGRAPYSPSFEGGTHVPAAALGLHIAAHGLVYLPPVVSGFVGADITAGIIATDLHRVRETVVLLDIGTNGEMVLAHRGRMWATSTAAGPAFEGVNICCGMRAAAGAIDAVVSTEDGGWGLHTIQESPAVGICGSGLIDLVSCLVSTGAVGRNGRFEPAVAPPVGDWIDDSGRCLLRLSGGVVLTQKDVRQVQLAKAAIRAGLDALLVHAGVVVDDVNRVLVAGSFGYHLRPGSLAALGMLPRRLVSLVEAAGNTSKAGAVTLLTSDMARGSLESMAHQVRVVELSDDPSFERRFVQQMTFAE